MREISGMRIRQREARRRTERSVVIFVMAACLALALVVFMAEQGDFSRLARRVSRAAIPGVTIDDDAGDNHATATMPVVTSLRSDSEAQRLGIRVGDHIDAVDGRPVRSVAALQAAIGADRSHGPVALHIRRGDAIWNIAIDRSEPADGNAMRAGIRDDPKDPAG